MYRWKAPSGKKLLMYKEPYWYSSGMVPYAGIGMPRVASMSGGFRTGIMAFGVGNHGGGPTRRDLNKAQWMKQWPVFKLQRSCKSFAQILPWKRHGGTPYLPIFTIF